jgi:hypothetical protein
MRYCLLILLFVVLSCSKEDRYRYEFAGAWNMVSLDQTFYVNGEVDSTASYTDCGVWLLEDNSSSTYNNLHYVLDQAWPLSFSNFLISAGLSATEGNTYWYTDYTTQDRLTVHEELYLGAAWEIFTVVKLKRNKLTLQYVQADAVNNQSLAYKEVFVLERM